MTRTLTRLWLVSVALTVLFLVPSTEAQMMGYAPTPHYYGYGIAPSPAMMQPGYPPLGMQAVWPGAPQGIGLAQQVEPIAQGDGTSDCGFSGSLFFYCAWKSIWRAAPRIRRPRLDLARSRDYDSRAGAGSKVCGAVPVKRAEEAIWPCGNIRMPSTIIS